MIEIILKWLDFIKANYQVNPYIFAVIYLVCAPLWWYSLYRTIDILRKKQIANSAKWLIILGFLTIAPFLYVAVFGKNLPLKFWIILLLIAILSVFNLFKKIRQCLIQAK